MTKVIRAIFTQILPGHSALRLVSFQDEDGKDIDDSEAGEWTADGENECLELRLATGEDAKPAGMPHKSALEKAWHDHAEGICGFSGAVPVWFSEAVACAFRHSSVTGKARILDEIAEVLESAGFVHMANAEGIRSLFPAKPAEPAPDNWQPPALEWHNIITHGGDCLLAEFGTFSARIPLRGASPLYIDEKKAHHQAEFNGYARHLLKLLGVEPPMSTERPDTGPQRRDAVVEAVRADLHRRSQLGIAKYGTTLAENTGDHRAKLQHFYEELLDGANYCKWAMMELDDNAGK